MIKPGEIQQKANKVGVRDQQIEKDYILSWILWGVASHEQLSKTLVFKGGTVLKKVYFEDYRFSEDLDFTLLDNEISNEQIFEWFKETFEEIKEEANIPLEIIDDNEHEDGGINFYISYIGPLGGMGNNKRVKVDISRSETLEFEPVKKEVLIDYTDLEEHSLLCYPLEELLVEKLRCTMQRMQPRDYYDIWYLVEMEGMDVEYYTNEFRNKCTSKELKPEDFHKKLEQKLPQYKARWTKSMSDQIKDLPDFEQVEREVSRKIKGFMA
ncbi:nucleotidyl transferase AbiEii/AbiGii toxin family protein [Flavobacterium gelidilacus]|uniref:nucleotidyl transferase AbiEii/AbiGii toxin family protein n=1 Tax=Flavobacterium gelidilacus TaxID=206041 RepID=UPI000403A180|nr:nucleotidyl transferase AbiEii/AbiGii toxin family protein [Flavobacterium gelidilacus]